MSERSELEGVLALLLLLTAAVLYAALEIQRLRAQLEPLTTSRLATTLAST